MKGKWYPATAPFGKPIKIYRSNGICQKHIPDDPLVQTVWHIYETVPPILQSLGKIKIRGQM
jgi:hypothetical protein